jgi:RNA polymerase sigma-70 factor (ECF subfamily)
MAEPPVTRPSLLVRLRDVRDAAAWQEFVRLYAPPVYGFARRRGLQDADAADLTQDVLRAVVGAVGRLEYDPRRGTFRGWLFTVVRRKVLDFAARHRRQWRGSGDTRVQLWLEEQPAGDDQALWNAEYERCLLDRAYDEVRIGLEPRTWQAFWLTAMEGHKARDAAAQLGMTVAAVYMAKSRVTAQLRRRLGSLRED